MMAHTVAAKPAESVFCKLHYKKINCEIDLQTLNDIFSQLPFASILGGNPARADAGRFSYWAAEPKDIFEFHLGQNNPFGKLQHALEKYNLLDACIGEIPDEIFCGGWVGYFGYGLGRYIEKLPQMAIDDLKLPLIRLCFYDRVICCDHIQNCFWLIALQLPNDSEKPQEKIFALQQLLLKAQKTYVQPPPPADLENIDISQVKCNITKDYYFQTIEKIKKYIFDGDVYQVNFSQRFECNYQAHPIELYHWQNLYNPSSFAAYLDAGDFQIVSASPEMFITIADDLIWTKPIKGTRPRINQSAIIDSDSSQVNAKNFADLLNSPKEQAELNMIIDLERNDLARICRYGTIKVIQPRTIETYPTVFHAVATVQGQLYDQTSFCDILKAMFPGGSITGAPKVSAMQIIEQTEPAARGVYTGSIGFIGINGNVSLNIAIRTIIIKDRTAFVQVGGGIVADSDAQAEWQETITKARALLAGINSVQREAYSG